MNNKEVEDCLVGKVGGWKFEGLVKDDGKTRVDYPFVFETAPAGDAPAGDAPAAE